jgi:hypothetical protein
MQLGPKSGVKDLKLRIGPLVGWLIRLTPPCSEVVRLISESMDHPLPLGKRISVRLHFLICKWCERYRQQLLFIRNALRRHPEKLEGQDQPPFAALSPEVRERIKRALSQQKQ